MQQQKQKLRPMTEAHLERIREYHEEQNRIHLKEHLIDEIPELQKHPKVQAEWPELNRDELIAMNLEELKEIRTAYNLTIEDQL